MAAFMLNAPKKTLVGGGVPVQQALVCKLKGILEP